MFDRGQRVCDLHQLPCVEIRFVLHLCSHALTDDGDHGKLKSLSGDASEGIEIVRYRICRDLRGAEARYDYDHEDTPELEEAGVFKAGRQAYVEYFPDDGKIRDHVAKV